MKDTSLKDIQNIINNADGVAGLVFPGVIPIPNERGLDLEIYINVNFGVKIPEVAWNLQESIKHNADTIFDINLNRINLHIEGINFNNKEEQ